MGLPNVELIESRYSKTRKPRCNLTGPTACEERFGSLRLAKHTQYRSKQTIARHALRSSRCWWSSILSSYCALSVSTVQADRTLSSHCATIPLCTTSRMMFIRRPCTALQVPARRYHVTSWQKRSWILGLRSASLRMSCSWCVNVCSISPADRALPDWPSRSDMVSQTDMDLYVLYLTHAGWHTSSQPCAYPPAQLHRCRSIFGYVVVCILNLIDHS